jgi:hypothetical protein
MAQQVRWVGDSGKGYDYWVYPINTTFKDEPGNYIYAKLNAAGNWVAVYIGQTSSLSQRLASHEKERSIIYDGGATHILAHLSGGALSRRVEEADLIRRYRPPFNESL